MPLFVLVRPVSRHAICCAWAWCWKFWVQALTFAWSSSFLWFTYTWKTKESVKQKKTDIPAPETTVFVPEVYAFGLYGLRYRSKEAMQSIEETHGCIFVLWHAYRQTSCTRYAKQYATNQSDRAIELVKRFFNKNYWVLCTWATPLLQSSSISPVTLPTD